MKRTLVLLGVGSTYFTRGIMESLIKKGGEWDVRLVDIDETCVEIAHLLLQKLADRYNAPISIRGSVERTEMLPGADAVVSTIGVGGRKAWEKDVAIFREFNIYQSTGDTYGAGGVSRALRTIPVLVDIARDIERLCPDALFINFTNPMTVNCRAVSKATGVKIGGLCYGVTYYEHFLAGCIGVPFQDVRCHAIGVNHFTWITDFLYNGKDAFPLLRRKMLENQNLTADMPFTWELFRMFDAFPCVGDGHICEFMPGWQSRGAYYGKTFGVDSMHNARNAISFEDYAATFNCVYKQMGDQAYGRAPLTAIADVSAETFRDEDLFIDVLNALSGEREIFRTVNLPNAGQANNLPRGAVLEATTLVNGAGFQPLCFGQIAPGIAAILQRIIGTQELTVDAALRGDRKLAIQALIAGETARTESEAGKIMDAILTTHRAYLPLFA